MKQFAVKSFRGVWIRIYTFRKATKVFLKLQEYVEFYKHENLPVPLGEEDLLVLHCSE